MTKIRLLVDMDGVLVNLEKSLFETYRRENPQLAFIDPSDRRGMYMDQQYRREIGEKEYQVLRDLLDRDHFFRDMLPIESAVKTLNHIIADRGDEFEVFVCTSPHWTNRTCGFDKMQWVRRYLPGLPTSNVVMTSDKTVVEGDYLIDDNEKIRGANREPKFKHVLARCHHNRHITQRTHKLILEDWAQIFEIVENVRK